MCDKFDLNEYRKLVLAVNDMTLEKLSHCINSLEDSLGAINTSLSNTTRIYKIPYTRAWVDLENVLEITEPCDQEFSYVLSFVENAKKITSNKVFVPQQISKNFHKETGEFDPDVYYVEMDKFIKEEVFQPFFENWCNYKNKQ